MSTETLRSQSVTVEHKHARHKVYIIIDNTLINTFLTLLSVIAAYVRDTHPTLYCSAIVPGIKRWGIANERFAFEISRST